MTSSLVRLVDCAAVAALSLCAVAQSQPATAAAKTAADAQDAAPFAALRWRGIGPFRGGRCTTVAGVPDRPLTYYFGSTGGGVWKTTDAGITWKNVSDGSFATGSVGAIAVAPSDPNVVYVGMGEAQVRGVACSHGDGVYRSDDAGRTWRHLGLERTRQIAAVCVHPRDPELVYVAAQGSPWGPTEDRGVYRSRDGGESWQRVLFVNETTGVSSLSLDPSNPRVLYAGLWDHRRLPWKIISGGEGSGVHKSSDAGETWTRLSKGLPDQLGKVGVAVSPARPERVWAIVEADEGGLFRSDDAGESFRRVNGDRVLRARAWYYTRVFADPVDADTVWVANAPLMKSIDGGRTFKRVRTPHGDNHALWVNPRNPAWLINGNDGGANVSSNGGETWSSQANQPTAQFYRVSVDRRFPYRLYGGQQDNSTVSIPSRTAGNGIGAQDWYPVGGGESAFVAFEPTDPRLIYAGVYQGIITEWDERTRATRNIMAEPFLGLGAQPKDLAYRFNWNAPILVSAHDAQTIYHAGNKLLRSRDRGVSWEEISPDLTRNEIDKQGLGGGPITNEAAGGETYNTIQYVAESPHAAGTLWVGSDDGLVHLTRDDGGHWSDVTPADIGEAMINAIEVSPHDAGVAYLAVTRYKFGDFTPHVWKTDDYGATWTRRVAGIGEEAFVRVVREDPVRAGLLYAGTEVGIFVSFDGGGHWQSLQNELPIVPITDLAIAEGDLIAATQGRGFWILDDLSPLRQVDRETVVDVHLFAPRAAVRFAGGGWREPPGDRGQNPPPGALLYYSIGEGFDADGEPLQIEILDASDRPVRAWSSEPQDGAADDEAATPGGRGVRRDARLKVSSGLHRLVWDLRSENVTEIDDQFTFGSRQGYRVAPGEYRVRLTVGERRLEHAVAVLEDPRRSLVASDYEEQQRVARALWRAADEIHAAVVRARGVRDQIDALLDGNAAARGDEAIAEAGHKLSESLGEWIAGVVQVEQETFQDVINFENRLNAHVLDLLGKVDSAGPPVTAGAKRRCDEVLRRWDARRAELEQVLSTDVSAFNGLFRVRGVPTIEVGR